MTIRYYINNQQVTEAEWREAYKHVTSSMMGLKVEDGDYVTELHIKN